MRITARVELTYRNEREAESIAEALRPDNRGLPKGLAVSTLHRGKKVINEVEIDGNIGTMLSTLDDILACAVTAENVTFG